ncbi:MAG TPA: hypothetical protein VK171_17055 [Fimbriimonas sp.]|nr:hypothetical protein [Fimbriimonas sp.]
MSARITFPAASASGTDVVLNVDRNSSPAAYVGTYNVGSPLTDEVKNFSVQFFAGAAQSGPVVANATATITWQGSVADLSDIVMDGKVASVDVVNPGTVSEVAAPFDLAFVAKDSTGAALALSPGAATWSVVSGASKMTVAADGRATPLLPGTCVVSAAVDGVVSPMASINISMVQITFEATNGGGVQSTGADGGDGIVVGSANGLPAMWTGSGYPYVDLTPPNCSQGQVSDGNLTTQVGQVVTPGGHGYRAAMWSGTAGSMVLLHPEDGFTSGASSVWGNRQGGVVEYLPSLTAHPGYWSGTAESWVDLLPPGGQSGGVADIDGSHEVGHVAINGKTRAAMWSGTPESFVDLSPTGVDRSYVTSINGDLQVGWGEVGTQQRAYAWRGTAASAIDLHPNGFGRSDAQVGIDNFAGGHIDMVATIWNVETKSFLSLANYVPATVRESYIHGGVRTSTGYDFVGTIFIPSTTRKYRAFVWHVPFRRMPQ